MNPLIILSAVGWGVFLLMQARRNRQPDAPAQAPAGTAGAGADAPFRAGQPNGGAPPTTVAGVPPVIDDTGAIEGGTPGLVTNWYHQLQAQGFGVDTSTGLITKHTPRGTIFRTARDAQEAARQGASSRRGGGHRGDAPLEADLY